MQAGTSLAVAVAVVGALVRDVSLRVQSTLGDEPYMDEIFHLRQAQAYCRGEFSVWDDKITTYPGLYFLSSGLHNAVRLAFSAPFDSTCSPGVLRLGNTLLVAITYVACVLSRQSRSGDDVWSAHLYALLITAYPLSSFYYPLYYTETASTCTLALMYFVSSKRGQAGKPKSQLDVFLLASAAIAMRQTNAVWALFALGTNMLEQLGASGEGRLAPETEPYFTQLGAFVTALLRNALPLARRNWGLLVAALGFVALVLRNGGVAVGDKDHHRPVLHAAMPLHLAVAASATLAPFWVFGQGDGAAAAASASPGPLPTQSRNGVLALARHAVCAGCVSAALVLGSLEHPFLLADNRHYTFYLWRRVLRFPLIRALLGPPYYLCLLFVARTLRRAGRGALWVSIYAVAAALTLVPTPLFEPRYWTPGVVVFLLNAPPAQSAAQRAALALSVCACLCANAAATYVFLHRPFTGVDGHPARFMY